ncbi:MAG: hypothetical protein FI687_02420 [SAR202 cluster bacterium]|nr:hypothetical protein [SAR202 cluster bacterium]
MKKNFKNLISVFFLIQIMGIFSFSACSTAISKEPPIIFSSNQNGNYDIFSIDSDGKNLKQLTYDFQDEFEPKVSSNREKIIFLKKIDGRKSIYLLDNNSIDLFVGGPYDLSSYIWSPVSDQIAYVSEFGPYIYLMSIDESEPLQLTSVPGFEVSDWSLDGKSIFFSSKSKDFEGIYVRNPDGVNENRLIDLVAFSPKLSPDGDKLIFLVHEEGLISLYIAEYYSENFSLKLVKENSKWYNNLFGIFGSGQKIKYKKIELPDDIVHISNVSWDPKSEKILFVSGLEKESEIYVVNIKKNNQILRLTRNNVRDDQPVWSPNGRKIAFVSYLDGDSEIFVMRPDGAEQNRITNNEYDDFDPDW